MYDGALADLIDQFGQLPGIGPKSAQRMAMHVLDAEPDEVARLVDAINAVRLRGVAASDPLLTRPGPPHAHAARRGSSLPGDGAQRSDARDLPCLSPPRPCVLLPVTHV